MIALLPHRTWLFMKNNIIILFVSLLTITNDLTAQNIPDTLHLSLQQAEQVFIKNNLSMEIDPLISNYQVIGNNNNHTNNQLIQNNYNNLNSNNNKLNNNKFKDNQLNKVNQE